jgi:hypothetical protein
MDAESTVKAFEGSNDIFDFGVRSDLNILNCWRAVNVAASASWISFQERFDFDLYDDGMIDMDEFIHYSRSVPIELNLLSSTVLHYQYVKCGGNPLIIPPLHSQTNGGVFSLIPGKLLLSDPPDDAAVAAAGKRDYADADGRRVFSSAFYADLLAHLGVALVVSFDDLPPAAAAAQCAAYAAAGVAYCAPDDLYAGAAGRGISLQSLDRFVALVEGCPGPVAVQCRQDPASGAARTHLAALMMRRCFSTAAEAEAWMHMVRPGRPAGPMDLALLEGLRAAGPRGRAGRARSLSICVCAAGGPPPLTSESPQPGSETAARLSALGRIDEHAEPSPASPLSSARTVPASPSQLPSVPASPSQLPSVPASPSQLSSAPASPSPPSPGEADQGTAGPGAATARGGAARPPQWRSGRAFSTSSPALWGGAGEGAAGDSDA